MRRPAAAKDLLLTPEVIAVQWYLVLAFIFVLATTVFAIQNAQQVTLRFLYWEFPSFPLVMLILFSAASGVLISLLFSLAKQFRQGMQIRDLQSRLRQMEKKLSQAAAGTAAGPAAPEKGPPPTPDNQNSPPA